MGKQKLGRDGSTVVRELDDGTKVSFTRTPDGLRANLHDGGVTRPVDPRAYGVDSMGTSRVGPGHARATLGTTNGESVDVTRRGDGSIDEQIHDGGSSRKK